MYVSNVCIYWKIDFASFFLNILPSPKTRGHRKRKNAQKDIKNFAIFMAYLKHHVH